LGFTIPTNFTKSPPPSQPHKDDIPFQQNFDSLVIKIKAIFL